MKRLTFLTFTLLFAATGMAQNSGRGIGQRSEILPPGDVIDVQFQGNSALSSDELATVTSTKVTGWFSRSLYNFPLGILRALGSPYQTIENATLQRDTAELNQYYRDRGFLLARTTYIRATNSDDLKAYNDYLRRERLMKRPAGAKAVTPAPRIRDTVIFRIQEGPPFTISRIAFEGLEALPNEFQPELTEHVTIKSGQRWSRPVAAREVDRLSKIMVENGYPYFRSDTIFVDHTEGKTTVNILLYFTPGHRFRYGPVHIVYDTSSAEKSRVAARVVLAQLYIDSGNWYNLNDIRRSEAALQKLGTFDLVRVSLDTNFINSQPDSLRDSTAVPVVVYLRMRQVGELQVGLFAGTTASQGFTFGGSLGVLERNLFRTADNANLQFSYQPYPLTQQRYSGSFDYHMPYIGLGRTPIAFGLGAGHQFQRVDPQYDQINFSGHVGSSVTLSKLDERTTLAPDFLVEYLITHTTDPTIAASAPKQQVNLLPSLSYLDDRTNDPLYPTAGTNLSVFFEYGIPSDFSGLFGGNTPSSAYLKLVPQIKYFLDLSSTGRSVVASRLRLGVTRMQIPDDPQRVPSYNHRFFGGGATSNRGWAEQALVLSEDPQWNASQGGFNDVEGNVEFRFAPWQYVQEFTSWQKLSSPVRFVLFYDIGNVWDNSLFDGVGFKFNRLAQTIGLGLRYNLFFGALRVDCGFKLYDPSGRFDDGSGAITQQDQGAWLFNSGRPIFWGAHTFNWHFGIGQTF